MMKFKMFLLLVIFCFGGNLFACDCERDEVMWAEAYKGNFSLVHKMALTREVEGPSDEITNQFVMAYVYYRMGHLEQIDAIFKGVDRYIEHKLGSKVK